MGNKQAKQSEKEEITIDEHTIPLDQLIERLGTDVTQGLSQECAKEILARDGPNKVKPHKDRRIREMNKSMYPENAVVVRGGVSMTIPCEEVVVGDVVTVKEGDKVPADVRVLSCDECRVDNSNLTGDSEPLALGTEYTSENPLETRNLAFFTVKVVEGNFKGLVFRVGDKTVHGSFAHLSSVL